MNEYNVYQNQNNFQNGFENQNNFENNQEQNKNKKCSKWGRIAVVIYPIFMFIVLAFYMENFSVGHGFGALIMIFFIITFPIGLSFFLFWPLYTIMPDQYATLAFVFVATLSVYANFVLVYKIGYYLEKKYKKENFTNCKYSKFFDKVKLIGTALLICYFVINLLLALNA
ncbi:hypothetical protein CSB11_00635 [Candidatus Campbellbacteria bacterium]|nr:MAG: hypothetical protein CSB11_00635 [Candidatus Campbellbacteria bacterium]